MPLIYNLRDFLEILQREQELLSIDTEVDPHLEIAEIHRRSLWQVLGIYLVGAWIGYEIIQALTEGLGLPDWVPGFAVVIFIIGLPIVLATALVQEGVPAPSHKDSSLPPDDQVAPEARRPDARPNCTISA